MATGDTTFGTIILKAQQRADMVNSGFITTSEWEGMANASLQNLYEKLIEAYGSDYWVQSPYSISTDGTNETYALPDSFFKLLGVDLQLFPGNGPSGYITIWRFNFNARNQFALPGFRTPWGQYVRYRLRGTTIWFTPLPQGGQVLRLWYAPVFTPLTSDSDVFSGINGWEEWAVNDIALKALTKEESDLSGVQALQAVQNDRLSSIIENRDAGEPQTVVDVYEANGLWPYGSMGGIG